MATDIPRIHKWWQQPSPNNDYIMSNFTPFVPSDLSANAQPPENAVNEQTDRWTDRQTNNNIHKQRFLTPGHQGWNDLHSLCRIGMEYYLLNNDDHNIIYWIMMIIMIMMMIIIMMTMMIIGTATIMIMIIIITTTLTMTIMKMIMIKTAQTPCQSLYKDRRI